MSRAKPNSDIVCLLGKRIYAIVGMRKGNRVPAMFILLDDHKSFIALEEQDPHDYHDCCASARTLTVRRDALRWASLKGSWLNATELT